MLSKFRNYISLHAIEHQNGFFSADVCHRSRHSSHWAPSAVHFWAPCSWRPSETPMNKGLSVANASAMETDILR